MSRTFLAVAAATSLLASAAFAQSQNQTMSPSSPSANPPAASPAPGAGTTTATPNAGTQKPQTIGAQKPDQFLASNFTGTDVYGPDNQKIGDVTDVLFDRNGMIQAVVVGVGGFLGIGSKDVALTMNSFKVESGAKASDTKLILAMSKEELQNAAEFKPYDPQPAPAPAASPGGSAPPRPATPSR